MLSNKKNVAVMVPTLSHAVEYNFSLGVRAGLPLDEFNITYMSVGWIESSDEHTKKARLLHQTLNFDDLDGIIMYGAGITNRSHPESVSMITNYYPDIPVINVGNVVGFHPSVVFDNRAPFRSFVQHLVVQKGCQRIAFVGGPIDNYDAIERRAGYIEGLEAQGLSLNKEYDWPGDFSVGSGCFAIRNYFNKAAIPPEAIVCANDLIALGVVNELLDIGLRVPEDVMVVGFDDLEYNKVIHVPLTTGRYPIFNMGKTASREMIEWLKGTKPQAVISADSSVIFRKSTGDDGDPRSQIATQTGNDRWFYSRDSNSDRLLINQAINRVASVTEIFPKIASNIYDVGCRELMYFQYNKDETRFENVYVLEGEQYKKLTCDDPLKKSLSISAMYSRLGDDSLQWVISPVQVEESFYGFVLAALVPDEVDFVEFIANEFSKKEENTMLAQEADEFRVKALKTEQMAMLGRLVSGLAHEINTPLGVSLVATTNLEEEVLAIQKKFKSNTITKEAFEDFLENCYETQKILYSSLKRTSDMVASFKQVSVDQHAGDGRTVNLADYIDEVLLSLKPKLKTSPVIVETNFERDIICQTIPGSWAQLITNLVLNALVHGFNDGAQNGRIVIDLKRRNDSIVLKVTDNGCGIPAENINMVFDPFFTTRKGSGGTGLGLNIVHNLVTQKLEGIIQVESHVFGTSENTGTEFLVTVPFVPE